MAWLLRAFCNKYRLSAHRYSIFDKVRYTVLLSGVGKSCSENVKFYFSELSVLKNVDAIHLDL